MLVVSGQLSVVSCFLSRPPSSAFAGRIARNSDFGSPLSFEFRHSNFVIRHSYLSASIGSTLAALRAGSQHARSATETRSSETTVKVVKGGTNFFSQRTK